MEGAGAAPGGPAAGPSSSTVLVMRHNVRPRPPADGRFGGRTLCGTCAQIDARLARVEQIKRFTVLPVYWEAGGDEITLTMKLKRAAVAEKYAGRIADLYRAEPPAGVAEPAAGPVPAQR